jgi:hypothetical protein
MQGDLNVLDQSYVVDCSSVDGMEAFLRGPAEHRHVDYFQGLEQFREHGLPSELPAAKSDKLGDDPGLTPTSGRSPSFKAERAF